jgi:hypothetical protein
MEILMHKCHAIDCEVQIAPKLLMCLKHWKMLPKKTQISIWNEYRPGQEVDKKPSFKYLAIQQLAVGEVASQESKEEQAQIAYRKSMEFALLAQEKENW